MAKGDRVNKAFQHPDNPKRGQSKKERGKGKLAMGKTSHEEWTKKFDPLYKMKGMDRYKAIKGL